jgi:hypothetical protein
MLYIVSLFEQSVVVRDLGLLSPTKSYHLGLGPIRTTGAPAASWQLIIFSTLLNSLLLTVAKILHTRYHCQRIARLATSGGIVASMWLNVGGAYELRVGCVSIESVFFFVALALMFSANHPKQALYTSGNYQ